MVCFRLPRMPFSSQPNHYLIFLGFFLLLLKSGTSQRESVSQTPNDMEALEGEDATLPCVFTTMTSTPNLFWYRQYGNQRPEKILTAYRYGNNHFQEGKFSTTLVLGSQKSVPLNIRSVSLLDGAVYFCALNAVTGRDKIFFGSGTRLVVMPNLANSNPSVYQLKPKEKESNLAACLITDYSPGPIDVKFNSSLAPEAVNDSAVVVKEDGNKESASLGVVIWSKNKNQFQCSAIHRGDTYKAEKEGDATCSETLSDKPVFETDENLNLLSLTVLGLRLIFFKSVALNLILTFWAWSR